MAKVQVRKFKSFTGHKESLYTLERVNGEELLSAGGDGMVVHWNLNNDDKGQVIAKVNASIYAMVLHDQRLIVGENFEGIHVIDLESKSSLNSLKFTNTAIFDIQVISNNYWIACGSGEIFVVNEEMQILHREKLSDKSARCICPVGKRNEVAIGFSDHSIKIIDQDTFEKKWQLEGHANSVFSIQESPDKTYLISGSRDARLKIWNVDNYELSNQIVAHMYAINHIEFSPNGQYFVTCSMDKSIKVWDANEFRLLKVIDKGRHAGHATSINKLKWMSGRLLAACSDDRSVSIWDIDIEE